jgi:hypothetical protein
MVTGSPVQMLFDQSSTSTSKLCGDSAMTAQIQRGVPAAMYIFGPGYQRWCSFFCQGRKGGGELLFLTSGSCASTAKNRRHCSQSMHPSHTSKGSLSPAPLQSFPVLPSANAPTPQSLHPPLSPSSPFSPIPLFFPFLSRLSTQKPSSPRQRRGEPRGGGGAVAVAANPAVAAARWRWRRTPRCLRFDCGHSPRLHSGPAGISLPAKRGLGFFDFGI